MAVGFNCQFSFSDFNNKEEMVGTLTEFAASLAATKKVEHETPTLPDETPPVERPRKGRKVSRAEAALKAAPPPPPEDDESEEGLSEEESNDLFDDEPATPPKPQGPTADEVITACKDHAAKHGRDKTMAILARFKVKGVKDLKPEDLPLVWKALKA
jgi:hypothetical protein